MGLYDLILMGQWDYPEDPMQDFMPSDYEEHGSFSVKFKDGSTFIYNEQFDMDTRRDGRTSDYSIADMVFDKAADENLTKSEILAYIEKVKNLESHEAIN